MLNFFKQAPLVECVILTGASAEAIKDAFDAWNRQFWPFGNQKKKMIVSCTMFGVSALIVFYYVIPIN